MLCASAAMLGVLSYTPQASAWRAFTFDAPGRLRVGMVGNQVRAVLLKTNGTCVWQDLGTGGLTDDMEIQGANHLTDGDNMAVVHTGQITFCGQTMTALIQNGFFIDMNGRAGPDVLSSFGNLDNYTWGGNGNDKVYCSGDSAEGGSGNDDIFGSAASRIDWLIGQGGFDTLCEPYASTADIMNGGTDIDKRCGTATNIYSVEYKDQCQQCYP
jgi:hypothetical protein